MNNPIRNIKLVLEYDGGRYHGWQRQSQLKNTVQGRIEYVLKQMTGEEIELHGAGRTDAGVHAWGQVANFLTNSELSREEIKAYLEKYLPDDIALVSLEEMPDRFHSRLNATGKVYVYKIWNGTRKNVFQRYQTYEVLTPLKLDAMRLAATQFIGTKDFKAFTANKSKDKSTVRTVDSITIEKTGESVKIRVAGDGFLHKMVRIIVGTLIQVGTGEIHPAEVKKMMEQEDRATSGFTAPPQGLYLAEVIY